MFTLKQSNKKTLLICCGALSLGLHVLLANATQPETAEIVFMPSTIPDAQPLHDQAMQLGTAVAIYEYVHNTFEYKPYHGSRSGSINTFMGQIGSDVDISTALIAMLRAQNIPARYAVGTVKIPAAQLINWLDVGNLTVAVQVLLSQGIQGVTLASDNSYVAFEHTWTEALVPFDQYRGIPTPTTVDCSIAANASRCNWVPLDGSFKQKIYNGLNLDPYTAISFDYTGYYNAILNQATDTLQRKDKNPLTILEDQIQSWLRTNPLGGNTLNTLDDVADVGQIIEVHDGLLPASLPYTLVDTPRHYDSVALHDAAVPAVEPKIWGKTLTINIDYSATVPNVGSIAFYIGSVSTSLLAQLNTQRLTFSTEFPASGNTPNIVVRLGGVEIARPITGALTAPLGYVPKIGDPYTITLSMDGTPDPTGGTDDGSITATYNAMIGGYYLIATGGESSNWSQVHRAANQLLTANQSTYKVVLNPSDPGSNGQACDLTSGINCTPYVDINGTGVYAVNDPPLLLDKPALDALTGGLLYVAATQYFANEREMFDRADHYMKTKTPIVGFLGMISSNYQAEYVNGTAFSILPGGLLIDMKGITIGGSYRSNVLPLTYSNSQFELVGHITSALEHETWQELTGYDAVSTVRGIQMALASGSTLVNVLKNSSTNTIPAFLNSVGFGVNAPPPFSMDSWSIFGTNPISWSNPTFTGTQGFDGLELNPISTADIRLDTLSYYNDDWDAMLSCFYGNQNALNSYISTYGGSEWFTTAQSACGLNWPAQTAFSKMYSDLQTAYNNIKAGNAGFFNYLDAAQGFVAANFRYRSKTLAANAYPITTIHAMRNTLALQDNTKLWVSYTLPSTLVTAPFNHFMVDIQRVYAAPTGRLNSIAFEILNMGP